MVQTYEKIIISTVKLTLQLPVTSKMSEHAERTLSTLKIILIYTINNDWRLKISQY